MATSKKELNSQDIWEMFAETDRRLDAKFKELAEQSKRTDEKLEKLIGTWGSFVEGLVEPAALRLFEERGIHVKEISSNKKIKENGRVAMEIDLLLENGEYAVLIEVKTNLKVNDVKEHIKRLSQFKTYSPRYADTKVLGAVAGIKISEGAEKYAYKQGLFVIAQSGDTVIILNDKKFKPKEW